MEEEVNEFVKHGVTNKGVLRYRCKAARKPFALS